MPDSSVQLERRVVGIAVDIPSGDDVVVGIDVDGQQCCFAKAKCEEAEAVGVTRDRAGGFFVELMRTP